VLVIAGKNVILRKFWPDYSMIFNKLWQFRMILGYNLSSPDSGTIFADLAASNFLLLFFVANFSLGEQHVGYKCLDFPTIKLSVVGGRPFSCGGNRIFRPKLLSKWLVRDMLTNRYTCLSVFFGIYFSLLRSP
jgi:hypothetical protein